MKGKTLSDQGDTQGVLGDFKAMARMIKEARVVTKDRLKRSMSLFPDAEQGTRVVRPLLPTPLIQEFAAEHP